MIAIYPNFLKLQIVLCQIFFRLINGSKVVYVHISSVLGEGGLFLGLLLFVIN